MMLMVGSGLMAQNRAVTGIVRDAETREPLVGAAVVLKSKADTTRVTGGVTGASGTFQIMVPPGAYSLRVEFIGYAAERRAVQVQDKTVVVESVFLKPAASQLGEVVVETQARTATQKGDTLQVNAAAYKTNPDANAEDLLRKMPGVTAEGGSVSAQGETVQRVLVDGKPFFGDDPNAALKNIPAQAIDKVQVYDQQSEQAQFSGFNDGNTTKTINIITKKDLKNSQFGKVYGGYGTDNRYEAGGNVNIFNGNQRISVLGMSNNINKQNFSTEDLASAFGSFSTGRRGRRGPMVFSSAYDFLVGDQPGITQTHSGGVNYSDQFGEKVTFTGSYFYNQTRNDLEQTLQRNYFTPGIETPLYADTSFAGSTNQNHRINARIEYKASEKNNFLFVPRISFQQASSIDTALGVNATSDGSPVSASLNDNRSTNDAWNLGGRFLWRHAFEKKGRTFSLETEGSYSGRNGEATLEALNFANSLPTDTLSQITPQINRATSWGVEADYTEPLGENSQLSLNYEFSSNLTDDDRQTFPWLEGVGITGTPDSLLSNVFTNDYLTNRGGVGYRYNKDKWQYNVDLRYQVARLDNKQTFPAENRITQTFTNWLPSGSLRYSPSKNVNVRMFFRMRTQNPSASQLQDVVNNSNPLVLSTGNPALRQSNTGFLGTRIVLTQPEKSRTFSLFAMVEATQDFITNATYIAAQDTIIQGVFLARGVQLSRPENASGYRAARAFADYGFPMAAGKLNLNLRAGFNFSRSPSIVNGVEAFADNTAPTVGLTLGSNLSESLDFTLSYNGAYNQVVSSVSPDQNNRYFSHSAGLTFNLLYKRFVFRSESNAFVYQGLQDGFNQNFLLWNLGFGRKFLKEDRGEIRLVVFDVLGQNQAISRNITETYFEDVRSTVLQRYFMLTFTYTFRHFKIQSSEG